MTSLNDILNSQRNAYPEDVRVIESFSPEDREEVFQRVWKCALPSDRERHSVLLFRVASFARDIEYAEEDINRFRALGLDLIETEEVEAWESLSDYRVWKMQQAVEERVQEIVQEHLFEMVTGDVSNISKMARRAWAAAVEEWQRSL